MPFETDLDRLIDRHALDIAVVTLPNADAPAVIARLAAANVHLLIDKPGARSAAELRPAAAAIEAAGVRAVVGLTRRYVPAARAARRTRSRPEASGGSSPRRRASRPRPWRVHDPANLLFDQIRAAAASSAGRGPRCRCTALAQRRADHQVMAMTGSVGLAGLAVEDVASVSVRFAGGAVGTIQGGYDLPAPAYRGRLALRGLDGSVELGSADDLVVLGRAADGRLTETRQAFAVAPAAGYGAQGRAAVGDLLGAIRDGRETEAPIEALVRALAVIDAAYGSARTGRLVRLDGT